MTVGQAVRQERQARGLSQLALANLVGVTQGRLWEYEADRRFPRADTLVAIAVALGIELRFGECSVTDTCPSRQMLRRASKHLARQALNNAIKRGELARPLTCQACGGAKPEAHHADYGKPLQVEWLCLVCHRRRHPISGVSPSSVAA